MAVLEVFFDYACPFCLKSFEDLERIRPQYPALEVEWRPCEAHPRPDRYGPHSDLCIQGMFFAREQQVDLWAYHRRMYNAVLRDGLDVENARALSACVEGLMDPEVFYRALQSGRYAPVLAEANRYAWNENGVWVVPAYRLGGRKLDAIENVGVESGQLQWFLQEG